jgi:hypothetical protein
MEPKNISNDIMKGLEFLKEKILLFFSLFSKGTDKSNSAFEAKKEMIMESINQSQKKYEKEVKDEEEKFKKEKTIILIQKNDEIKKIENNKKKEINQDNKRHKNLLAYLDSIKNDKNKIIEFLQNKNYL